MGMQGETLTELMAADFTPKTPEELEEFRESEYRRGYRDGWVQAIDAMFDLIQDKDLPASSARKVYQAYHRCWVHGERALWEWALGDCSKVEWPPLPY